ncbi:galactoside-binding lectin [Ancylostoma ceylanicum]|uniref:Galectin n=1 Tax=Ancylostoma ceylanicum TaxID=53326 RepID=A0A0D6M0U8_9BILA|nr:galactoside-binding lectin [Ancylostoma ceylanicum]
MHVVQYPPVPSAIPLNEQLRDGCKIDVHGKVEHGHHKNFAVELLSGPHIVLHINFRFHHEHEVVMNSCSHGSWGPEKCAEVLTAHLNDLVEQTQNRASKLLGPREVTETKEDFPQKPHDWPDASVRHRNPLHHNDHFHLHIHVRQTHYDIEVNGHHLASFHHRFPVESVQALGLKGDVHVEKINFGGFHFHRDWNVSADFGHAGYIGYGTASYAPPTFNTGHQYNAYF